MILDTIIEQKKIRVNEKKKIISIGNLYDQAYSISKNHKTNSFEEVLKKDKFTIIGEFKKASPSKGVIVEEFNINNIFQYYNKIGVDAFSILTEEDFFQGNDSYINEVKDMCNMPILRKDFIIDLYQIYETKILGADGILLIVSALKDKIGEFYNEAKKLNLAPLVEVHTREELELALRFGCEIIGINNRNLNTFNTTLDTTEELIKQIPNNHIVISESGIKTIGHLELIKSLGVNGVLVGEMFMRNMDNERFINEYKEFRYDRN